VFLGLASATESHCLPHWEKQEDGKISGALEKLGVWLIAAGSRAGAGDAACLYKLCSWDCPTLHHNVDESPMTHMNCYIKSQILRFSKTLSFLQISTSHFKVFFGAQQLGFIGSIVIVLGGANPTLRCTA